MKSPIISSALLLLFSLASTAALADVAYVGTRHNIASWQVWANGSGWITPVQVTNNDSNGPIVLNDWVMGLSSDGSSAGTIVTGFDPTNWNGVWFARASFNLPASATNVHLDVYPIIRQMPDLCCGRYIYATDDRVILSLGDYFQNTSANVGWYLSVANDPASYNAFGQQNTDPYGQVLADYTYADLNHMMINDPSAFVPGGTNWIYLTINNTGHYGVGGGSSPWGDTDPTFVGFDAYVGYTATPEPCSLLLFGTGVVGFVAAVRRKLLV